MRFRVFVRPRGGRVPRRGAASAARQDKKIALVVSKAVAFLLNGHFPYGQLVRLPGHERLRTHAGGPGPRGGRFRAFHGEDINGSCLDCSWARGKLPKPTSRVYQQAGQTPLPWPPTLGMAAAGPVTPAGRVGGGVTAASKLFSRRKTMVGWRNGTQRQIGDWPSLTSLIHHTKVRRYTRTYVHTFIRWSMEYISSCGILFHVVYCNLQFFQQPWRSPIYSRPESELRRVHSLNCTRQFCALEA